MAVTQGRCINFATPTILPASIELLLVIYLTNVTSSIDPAPFCASVFFSSYSLLLPILYHKLVCLIKNCPLVINYIIGVRAHVC